MKYAVSMDFEVLQFSDKTPLAKFNETIVVTIPSYATQDSVECLMHVENQARLAMFYQLRVNCITGFPPGQHQIKNALFNKSFIVRGELRSYRPV